MAGLTSSGASSRPASIDPARASGAHDTLIRLGSGSSAFGEQINAVLSAGFDTRTPVAPVALFADDPQRSWLAEGCRASLVVARRCGCETIHIGTLTIGLHIGSPHRRQQMPRVLRKAAKNLTIRSACVRTTFGKLGGNRLRAAR